ncbi:MAG: hypothetical protein CGW95_01085 [Phenylobacterium zucineum]|nr:MAG: hypothetical protein CGW95_01085 [Phenylobacterium zucineum]
MLAELLKVILPAILKAFGDAFLQWRRDQDAQKTSRELGRKEQEAADYEDAAQRADEIGGIASRPADRQHNLDRLRDGTA